MNTIVKMKLEQFDTEQNIQEIMTFMKTSIGDKDPVLREELIFTTFNKMVQAHHIKNDEKYKLIKWLLGENGIHYHINEKDDDAVYTRSYASLWLLSLITHDKEQPVLTRAILHEVVTDYTDYMLNETDRRGYTEHGWAHAAAHAADVLDALIHHPNFSSQYVDTIVHALISTVTVASPYTAGEISRLTNPAFSLLNTQYAQELINEIDYKMPLYYDIQKNNSMDTTLYTYENCKHFVHELYFKIDGHPYQNELKKHCMKFL